MGRIDRSKLKRSYSEVPPECRPLIEKLKSCNESELLAELKQIDSWNYGKCELYHWIDVLDRLDWILEKASARIGRPDSWQLACDQPNYRELKDLTQAVLNFTAILIEQSFSRHLYSSVDHLLVLLTSCDLNVVLGVINLLYMFSKRSNFIPRLEHETRDTLIKFLSCLAESWGGKENGFGLADCCKKDRTHLPSTATTVHYEFRSNNEWNSEHNFKSYKKGSAHCIHLDNVDKMGRSPAEIMDGIVQGYEVPIPNATYLFTHIRLACNFTNYERRLLCVQVRLQALTVLLYSNSYLDPWTTLLYPGLLEELVELLELNNSKLVDIKAAALRTLTSIIHIDRAPGILPRKPALRLDMIIDATGAALYHGFLPQMVRSCINSLVEGENSYSLPLATALFSFLYHMASCESGGEALVNSGMMEALLRIINWNTRQLEHIPLATRAVRMIDLITNVDMQIFQIHGGLESFINRLEMEINICKEEQPGLELLSALTISDQSSDSVANSSEPLRNRLQFFRGTDPSKKVSTCLVPRAALLKTMLNFLKKALQDPAFSESVRHFMDGSLPTSLTHIISNAEYYGPSLFLLATNVITVCVFQEPSLLSTFQDNGLTDFVFHALLVKDVPATREVLGSLPNVFSALSLNIRGLHAFIKYKPFDRIFRVLISPKYLPAMKKRRSADSMSDTATNLGNAMDELMRHQPSLKTFAFEAIITLLEDLCGLGYDPKFTCYRPQKGQTDSGRLLPRIVTHEVGSSDEEDDEEEESSSSSQQSSSQNDCTDETQEKYPIPLIDYILNVTKFVDAILSNNSTEDHCRQFVTQGGLVPLLNLLRMPNLPLDYPITSAAQSVATVCKSILNLAHDNDVLNKSLSQLKIVLEALEPLYQSSFNTSILLHELANVPNFETAFTDATATPLLHHMSAVHGYITLLIYVCKTGQLDIRTITMQTWGSQMGIEILKNLTELYTALVWESNVLLALCKEEMPAADSSEKFEFCLEDINKLVPPEMRMVEHDQGVSKDVAGSSSGTSAKSLNAAQFIMYYSDNSDDDIKLGKKKEIRDYSRKKSKKNEPCDDSSSDSAEVTKPDKPDVAYLIPPAIQLKYIKPLVAASSRLGRALAELFGLLTKLCVGFPARTRRGNHLTNTPVCPTPAAEAVSNVLANLLAQGLNYSRISSKPPSSYVMTYLLCFVGFTSPLLFDEKKLPYHLMLQKFIYSAKGIKSFVRSFIFALHGKVEASPPDKKRTLDLNDRPQGTIQFIEAWFSLLEKMVNPRTVLESNHMLPKVMPPGDGRNFDANLYLQQMHWIAFIAVEHFLDTVEQKCLVSLRATDSVLTILKHVMQGEYIMLEKSLKFQENGLGQMVPNLLNPTIYVSRSNTNSNHSYRREIRVENEMEAVADGEPGSSNSSSEETDEKMFDELACQLGSKSENLAPYTVRNDASDLYIPKALYKRFMDRILQFSVQMLDLYPQTVYRLSELVIAVLKRGSPEMIHQFFIDYSHEMSLKIMAVVNISTSPKALGLKALTLQDAVISHQIADLLHFYMLLFEEMRIDCGKAMEKKDIQKVLLKLLQSTSEVLQQSHKLDYLNLPLISMPKMVAPLLLVIDVILKVSTHLSRKAYAHDVTTGEWKWYDLQSGKWMAYTSHNNRLINDAYWRGCHSLRISSNRKRYTIAFLEMCQSSEDSGVQRPIMMCLKMFDPAVGGKASTSVSSPSTVCKMSEEPASSSPATSSYRPGTESTNSADLAVYYHTSRTRIVPIKGFTKDQNKTIIQCCLEVMKHVTNSDTLHAVLQVLVRLTRDYNLAKEAAKKGVVDLLLQVDQSVSFTGFIGLATIIIRHILEEPEALSSAMEKVIRNKTLTNIPPAYKEFHYVIRECAPAIARDPDMFKAVFRDVLRYDATVLDSKDAKKEEDDGRIILKNLPNTQEPDEIGPQASQALENILMALYVHSEDDYLDITANEMNPSLAGNITKSNGPVTQSDHLMGGLSSTVFPDDSTLDITFSFSARAQQQNTSSPSNKQPYVSNNKPKKLSEQKKLGPVMTKSTILKLLSDAVRSYSSVAKYVTNFRYPENINQYGVTIKGEVTFIRYVLDTLLPKSGSERTKMIHTLFASLASCNHSPDSQMNLVVEVKDALKRALNDEEKYSKHSQIQNLVDLITTMIENCPPVPLSSSMTLSSSLKLNQYSVNNMVRLLIRKGMAAELARIPQYIDLSGPEFTSTMNAVLKPLETLTRIMSQPPPHTKNRGEKGDKDAANKTQVATRTDETATPAPVATAATPAAEPASDVYEIYEIPPAQEMEDTYDRHFEETVQRTVQRMLSESHDLTPLHSSTSTSNNQNQTEDDDDDDDDDESSGASSSSDSNLATLQESNLDDADADTEVDENVNADDDTEGDDHDEEDWIGFEEDALTVMRGDRVFSVHLDRNDLNNRLVAGRNQRTTRIRHIDSLPIAPDLISRFNSLRNSILGAGGLRSVDPSSDLQIQTWPAFTNLRSRSTIGSTSNGVNNEVASTRVVVMDNGIGLITNSEEEQINFVDQSGYLLGPSLAATLSNIPTAMHYWTEESRLLDADTLPYLAMSIAYDLLPFFESQRTVEVQTKKEKSKKVEDEQKASASKKTSKKSKGGSPPAETTVAATETLVREVPVPAAPAPVPVSAPVAPVAPVAPAAPVVPATSVPSSVSSVAIPPPRTPQGSQTPSYRDFADAQRFALTYQALLANWQQTDDQDITDSAMLSNWMCRQVEALQSSLNRLTQDLTDLSTPNASPIMNIANTTSTTAQTTVSTVASSTAATVTAAPVVSTASTTTSTTATIEPTLSAAPPSAPPSQPETAPPATAPAVSDSSANADSSTLQIPEGVDPSFLEALPEDMRTEVITEHLRLERLRESLNAAGQGGGTSMQVNADFLAALPPSIQEEVLIQQRLENQRQAAATADPNDPVDPADFFENLPPQLRTAILSDMHESQITALPPELQREARGLRREYTERHGFEDSLYSLRSDGTTQNNQPRSTNNTSSTSVHPVTFVTRQILDNEAVACLLVLLFHDDMMRLNTARLHRVIRNVCCHAPTLDWVFRALLSITDKCNEAVSMHQTRSVTRAVKDNSQVRDVEPRNWLNLSLETALGSRTVVFNIQKTSGRRGDRIITIHPIAAPLAFRNTLELLSSMVTVFAPFFVPKSDVVPSFLNSPQPSTSKSRHSSGKLSVQKVDYSNFWDILNHLDNQVQSKKGKTLSRAHSFGSLASQPLSHPSNNFDVSPFGRVLKLLSSPVVKKNSLLMDKLLNLLAQMSSVVNCTNHDSSENLITPSDLQLNTVIEVLTSNSCSEHGLEDATRFLISISMYDNSIRSSVLLLLMDGARKLADQICILIKALFKELRSLSKSQPQMEEQDESSLDYSRASTSKGIVSNRFSKDSIVVINGPVKPLKSSVDLQLCSMAPLVSKTSSQTFFLRILRVILQLRALEVGVKKQANNNVSPPEERDEANARREEQNNVNNLNEINRNRGSSDSSLNIIENNLRDTETARSDAMEASDVTSNETNNVATDTAATNPITPPVGNQPVDEETVSAESNQPANADTPVAMSVGNSPQPEPPQPPPPKLKPLSEQLQLDHLWDTLSSCLTELARTQDYHAVLILQPAIEAFFLVHTADNDSTETQSNATQTKTPSNSTSASTSRAESANEVVMAEDGPSSSNTEMSSDSNPSVPSTSSSTSSQQKFLKFAETHRAVLNQILRQSTIPLLEGPFAVLINHTRILDFDVKRKYFRSELDRCEEGHRRDEVAVHVQRSNVFEDSFRELFRRTSEEWKNRFYIVFEGEEGQDAGGLLREWYMIISRDIFNPMYALFKTSPGDRVTYMINPSSNCNPNHLYYFKFVGRVIAKAIYDNKLLDCYFTRSFYKHILGIPVKFTDMESEDYTFYQGLAYLMENGVSSLGYELTLSTEVQEFGVTEVRDLVPNGRFIPVTEENKMDYIQLVCQMKMTGAIRQQLTAFLEGFYDIIPKKLISIFNEQELELLISGLPNVDIDDLKANTEYYKYQPNSIQIQWFWRALRSFDQADRAKFLQFVTGTSKVPLQGFAALEGMNGVQKFQIHRDERSTDRLPSAHTCFNQLDLPVYESYNKLYTNLLKAIHECSEGFGFA
ncbi:E3 ubiquitin-protein ligase HUWE1 isoform X2 [Bemisia tabaci]|uniref:E3 ubiquitin-protein ligase HUWE1 isoform X2 n=1 Tax=Bemisia tabaci TaxID=7038 RepID=UPI003B2859F4